MMTRWANAAFIGAVACCVALLLGGSSQPVLANSHHVLLASLGDEACDGECEVCTGEGVSGHAAEAAPATDPPNTHNEGDGWHEKCAGTSNCSGHICLPEFASAYNHAENHARVGELFAALGQAVATADEEELIAMLQEHEGTLEYLADRQALQVLGCDGKIVAHYPIEPSLSNELN